MRRNALVIFIVLGASFVGAFLLVDTSGLLGRSAVTPTTAAATVNGEDILAMQWYQLTQQMEEQEAQSRGTISLDDREQIADRAFEQMVMDVLLRQEYERRGITVTNEEIRQAALYSPPPDFLQNPELQTEGRFDPAKYQRLLTSSAARQQGLLLQLESYYRAEIPRQKLFDEVASDLYLTERQLWTAWRDRNDSARMSFIRFGPELVPDARVTITDVQIRTYYDRYKTNFERPARAQVSVMIIPRRLSAADTAATRARAATLREEIAAGRRQFDAAAREESADSGSAAQDGDLGRGARGRFVDEFEDAAYALPVGVLSQPVLTQFGYHIIRVDERKGDTLGVRHILLRIQQSDSAAAITDRRADSLSRIAGAADDPRKFDEASRVLGLPIMRGIVLEGEQFTVGGQYVPSVAAWALGGSRAGEVSELFDWDEGYVVARLDSLVEGGEPKLETVKDEIRALLVRRAKLDGLVATVASFAAEAARGSLERAARAHNYTVVNSGWFNRLNPVEGVGRANEAIGAAFALPVGRVSSPVKTLDGVFVLRVDERRSADSAAFAAAKTQLKSQELAAAREQRVRQFLRHLRENADVDDRRKQIAAAQRRVQLP